mgnify:FL=1
MRRCLSTISSTNRLFLYLSEIEKFPCSVLNFYVFLGAYVSGSCVKLVVFILLRGVSLLLDCGIYVTTERGPILCWPNFGRLLF